MNEGVAPNLRVNEYVRPPPVVQPALPAALSKVKTGEGAAGGEGGGDGENGVWGGIGGGNGGDGGESGDVQTSWY